MVSDSKCSAGGTWYPITKIYRVGDDLVGLAGDVKEWQAWLKWYRADKKGPRPKLDDFSALVLRPDGLYEACSNGLELKVERGFHAVGSGGNAAAAVMLAGHSAEEAVRIACLIDNGSGGDLQIHRLKG